MDPHQAALAGRLSTYSKAHLSLCLEGPLVQACNAGQEQMANIMLRKYAVCSVPHNMQEASFTDTAEYLLRSSRKVEW